MARFLRALHAIPAADGPPAGPHNFHRGGKLRVYDAETHAVADRLAGRIDRDRVLAVWDRGLATDWQHAPVWVHGDVAANNLLVRDGRLVGVLDWGSSGIGDPACDLVIAWTLLDDEARAAFRLALPLDADTWARGRAWALWKALLMLAEQAPDADAHERTLRRLLADDAVH